MSARRREWSAACSAIAAPFEKPARTTRRPAAFCAPISASMIASDAFSGAAVLSLGRSLYVSSPSPTFSKSNHARAQPPSRQPTEIGSGLACGEARPKLAFRHGEHDDLVPYAWGEAAMSHALEKGGIPSEDGTWTKVDDSGLAECQGGAVTGACHMALLSNENVLNKASDLIGEFAK